MSGFEKFLADIRAGDLQQIMFILTLVAIGSGYFSFAGMALDANGFLGTTGASIFGVLSGSVIWLIWHVAFRVIPSLTERKYILMAWSILTAAMALILLISSFFNATALRGEQAVALHTEVSIGQMQTDYEVIAAQTFRLEGVAADLEANRDRFHNASGNEFRTGLYSGSPGPGAIEGTQRTIGDRYEQSRKAVQGFLDEVHRTTPLINALIEKMRKIQKSKMRADEKRRKIMALADEARDKIRKIDGRVLAASIARTLASLPAEVDQGANLSDNPALAARQAQGLERLSDDLSTSTLPIIDNANSIANADPVVIKPFETLTYSQAVLRYWYAFKPQWGAAIALDLAPLIALIFVTIALRTKSEKDLAEIDLLAISMGDIVRATALADLVRQAVLNQNHAQSLLNRALGQQSRDETGESNGSDESADSGGDET